MSSVDLSKAPCRVRIIKASKSTYWYANSIGEEFDVDLASPPKDYVVWEDYIAGGDAAWRHIIQADCERIYPCNPSIPFNHQIK